MAFCANCGTQFTDNAKFCLNCGQPPGAAGSASHPPSGPAVPPLKYEIEGHNLQIARVHLMPGQEIFAEAGKMIYKTANVEWTTRMVGQSLGDKILGAIKRKLMGESLFFTYFHTSTGQGEVGFAGHYPGKIQVLSLRPARRLWCSEMDFCLRKALSLSTLRWFVASARGFWAARVSYSKS